MKIGIVTFQYAYNYGAVLQCYSLQSYLSSLGHDVTVINYYPKSKQPLHPLRGWSLKNETPYTFARKKLIQLQYRSSMMESFDKFRDKYLNLSPRLFTAEEVGYFVENYDMLIAGSDQIWHFSRDKVYFLEFGVPFHGKRVSYAACCGSNNQPEKGPERVSSWLTNFDSISVRNDFSQYWVNRSIGVLPSIACDPVLLSDLHFANTRSFSLRSDYILVYTIGSELSGGIDKLVNAVVNSTGITYTAFIGSSVMPPCSLPTTDISFWDASPDLWLSVLSGAKFVITDSFHGALTAAKYNIPFLTYYTDKRRGPRLEDISLRYSLTSSLIDNSSDFSGAIASCYCNYSKTIRLIDQHVRSSKLYLNNILKCI